MNGRICAVLLSGLLGAASSLQAVRAEAIPDPRPAGFVTDGTGTLSEAHRATLDEIGRRATFAGRGDLAVAVVGSTEGVEPRAFATALYNRWRLGAGRGDFGALLFVALSDRAVEIVLGDGLDSPATRQIAQDIVDAELVPRFRAGEPAAAITSGAEAMARRLLGAPAPGPAEAEPPAAPSLAGPASALASPRSTVPAPRPTPSAEEATLAPEAPLGSAGSWGALAVFLFLVAGAVILGLRLRHRRAHCDRCGAPWVLLAEEAEDAHLPATAATEERIGSVDYDVLRCPGCQHQVIRRRARWFSGFQACPRCSGLTVKTESTVLSAPTLSRTGRQRVVLDCEHCEYRHERIVILPREEASSASSSSSSSASSWSSSSSSSSSGSGHSSGGGASGRW